jgi:transposase, IS30 family
MITGLLRNQYSCSQIAKILDRSRSTIYRELARNRKPYDDKYRAEVAQSRANGRRSRTRRGSRFSYEDWRKVISRLERQWSPEQISGDLRKTLRISHQTIYAYIRENRRIGGLLYMHLRIVSKFGRKRRGTPFTRGVGPNKKHISERPPEVETRQTIGHWEGDTVIGKDKHACILTLVERKSGLVRIRKLDHRTTEQTNRQLIRVINVERTKCHTVTFDNGTEFHQFKEVEYQTGVDCYFATPYHSWERGSNENTNGLIRQYIPKGQCMKNLTQEDCNLIAYKLNTRPRKRHNFKTPLQVYNAF